MARKTQDKNLSFSPAQEGELGEVLKTTEQYQQVLKDYIKRVETIQEDLIGLAKLREKNIKEVRNLDEGLNKQRTSTADSILKLKDQEKDAQRRRDDFVDQLQEEVDIGKATIKEIEDKVTAKELELDSFVREYKNTIRVKDHDIKIELLKEEGIRTSEDNERLIVASKEEQEKLTKLVKQEAQLDVNIASKHKSLDEIELISKALEQTIVDNNDAVVRLEKSIKELEHTKTKKFADHKLSLDNQTDKAVTATDKAKEELRITEDRLELIEQKLKVTNDKYETIHAEVGRFVARQTSVENKEKAMKKIYEKAGLNW